MTTVGVGDAVADMVVLNTLVNLVVVGSKGNGGNNVGYFDGVGEAGGESDMVAEGVVAVLVIFLRLRLEVVGTVAEGVGTDTGTDREIGIRIGGMSGIEADGEGDGDAGGLVGRLDAEESVPDTGVGADIIGKIGEPLGLDVVVGAITGVVVVMVGEDEGVADGLGISVFGGANTTVV